MRVLIAYDGSAGAADALALAETLPWPRGSELRVINVIEPVPMPMAGPWNRGFGHSPEIDAATSAYAAETLKTAADRLRAANVPAEPVERRGRAASVIVDEAAESGADLVIIGSRGHGTLASLLIGSTSAEVVDHAACPVLVARTPSVSRLVLATDGSPSARAAEDLLATWAVFSGMPIDVVSVVEVVRPWTTGIAPTMYGAALEEYAVDLRESKAEHTRIAEETAARLREAGATAHAEVREGDPAGEVVAAAQERGAELIVLGSRGRTGLTRLVLGSVARNVLSGSEASVLIVRGPDAPDGA
jgi:nucleotide-binding universal stress UspA family protein